MQQLHPILKIGELADRYGVSTESLRIWERQGLIPPSVRTPGGHRRYGAQHVRALDTIMGVHEPFVIKRFAVTPQRFVDHHG